MRKTRSRGARAAAALVVACALGAASDAEAGAPRTLGLNVHQSADVGLDATRDANLDWVRVDMNWLQAEPAQQGTFDWTIFDAQINAAKSKNLKVLAVLAYGPAWASQGDTKADGSNNDVPKPGTYAAFVTAAVKRYSPYVTHYEIWNEPNLGQFFEGTVNDYLANVLEPGADAVHAACATCMVVGPTLATVGTEYATWMDTVLGADASKIDIVSGHIYAGFTNLDANVGTTKDSFLNKLESHRVIKIGATTVYEGPLSFKEVMDKHGVSKPFWLTETGQEATAGTATEEQSQVTYYSDVLDTMASRAWWTNTIFYEAFDEPGQPYHWGVVVHQASGAKSYTPKQVFSFLQGATAALQDAGANAGADGGMNANADAGANANADAGGANANADAGATADADAGANGDGDANASGNGYGGCSVRDGGGDDMPPFVLAAGALAAILVRARRRLGIRS